MAAPQSPCGQVARCEARDESGLTRLKQALAAQLAASGVDLPAGF